MADTVTKEQRSVIMRRVGRQDTAPEIRVRRALHAKGFRFRLHRRDLPGTPDIVLPQYRLCIFVHGCFWHGHENCPNGRLPKSRTSFWANKITRNRERDRKVQEMLVGQGWRVVTVWECRTKSNARLEEVIEEISLVICSGSLS